MRNSGPPGEPESETRSGDVAVVVKTIDLLEVLADGESVGLTAISERVGISKASAYRVLSTLMGLGYVAKRDSDRRYGLGPRLVSLSGRVMSGQSLVAQARPILEAVLKEFDETVNLGVLSDAKVLYVSILESRRDLRMAARVGQRDPLHTTALGKAMLAQLPDADVDQLLGSAVWERRTSNTITSLRQLKKELSTVRERGYAIDNAENEPGAICVAVPILEGQRKCSAAVSVSGPRMRISDKMVVRIAQHLEEAATNLERRLGYVGREARPNVARKPVVG